MNIHDHNPLKIEQAPTSQASSAPQTQPPTPTSPACTQTMARRTLRRARPALPGHRDKMVAEGIDPNATALNWNVRRPTQGPVGLAIKNRTHRVFFQFFRFDAEGVWTLISLSLSLFLSFFLSFSQKRHSLPLSLPLSNVPHSLPPPPYLASHSCRLDNPCSTLPPPRYLSIPPRLHLHAPNRLRSNGR